jgi:uncharacterized protein
VKKFKINAFEYALNEKKIDGNLLVRDSQRLCSEFTDQSTKFTWMLVGEKGSQLGYPQLSLKVEGSVKVVCQRCLVPFFFIVSSKSTIVLAKDEEDAELIDSILDNGEIDVIVCPMASNLSVAELIEDEILLHMPTSPRHYPVCPSHPLKSCRMEAMEKDKNISSFEILKSLQNTIS